MPAGAFPAMAKVVGNRDCERERERDRAREREGGEGSSSRWRELGFLVVGLFFCAASAVGVKKGRLEKAETLCSLNPCSTLVINSLPSLHTRDY